MTWIFIELPGFHHITPQPLVKENCFNCFWFNLPLFLFENTIRCVHACILSQLLQGNLHATERLYNNNPHFVVDNTPLEGYTSLFNQSLTDGQFACFQYFTFFIFWYCFWTDFQRGNCCIKREACEVVSPGFPTGTRAISPQPCQQSMLSNFWLLANLWVRHGFHSRFFHLSWKWEIFCFNP